MGIKKFIGHWLKGQGDAEALREQGKAVFREIVSCCPLCGGPLQDHYFCFLCTAVLSDQAGGTTSKIRKLVDEGRWLDASRIQEGDMLKDLLQFFFLKCRKEGLAIVEYRSYFDIWLDDRVVGARKLDLVSAQSAEAVVNGRWVPF